MSAETATRDFVHCVYCGHEADDPATETHEPDCPETTQVFPVTAADVEAEFRCSGPEGCGYVFNVGDAMHYRYTREMHHPVTGAPVDAFVPRCTDCAASELLRLRGEA